MTELDCAYIAGLFDGEGCVFINQQNPNPLSDAHRKSISHTLYVVITNTNKAIIDWLLSTVGGCLSTRYRQRTCYDWKLTGASAAKFLKEILPYLKIKREQAEVAINFQETKILYKRVLLPDDELKRRQEFRKRLRAMK